MIYGVDLGSRRVAIAGPDYLCAALKMADPRPGTGPRRISLELDCIGEFVAAVIPQMATIWVEEPFVGFANQNIRTAIRLGMSAGAVLHAHHGPGYVFNNQTWKAEVVGNGRASKAEIAQWLWANDPASAEACYGDEDLIDACCIRHYGVLVAEGRVEEPWQLPRRRR